MINKFIIINFIKRWKFLRNTFGWEKSISDFEGISASIRKPISQAPLVSTWYTSLQNASHRVWCPFTDYSLVRAQPTAGRRLMYIIYKRIHTFDVVVRPSVLFLDIWIWIICPLFGWLRTFLVVKTNILTVMSFLEWL